MKLTVSSRNNYSNIMPIVDGYLGDHLEVSIKRLADKMGGTMRYIHNIYNKICLTPTKFTETLFDPTLNSDNIVKVLNKHQISEKDKTSKIYIKYLELSVKRQYTITIYGIIFNIIFYCKRDYSMFDIVINRFLVLCEFSKDRILKLSSKLKEFNIYLVLYDLNRQTIIGRKMSSDIKDGHYNCSSGYTSLYVNDNKINNTMLITRLPEHLGLFTHEMGHLLGYDFGTIVNTDSYMSLSGMVNSYNCPKKILDPIAKNLSNSVIDNFEFMESINNYNTTIIHSIFNAIEIENTNEVNYLALTTNLIRIEVVYSIFHTAKILFRSGFSSYESFFDNRSKEYKLDQKAFLFEYTIVRALMFINNDILDIMKYRHIDGDKVCTFTSSHNMCEYQKKVFVKESFTKVKSILNYFLKNLQNTKELNMEYFCIDLGK